MDVRSFFGSPKPGSNTEPEYPTEITELATTFMTIIMKHYSDNTHIDHNTVHRNLCIDSIDNVIVSAYICDHQVRNMIYIGLQIDFEYCYNGDTCENEILYKDTFLVDKDKYEIEKDKNINQLCALLQSLTTIKFDKFKGEFISKTKQQTSINDANVFQLANFNKYLCSKNNNIKCTNRYDECCVCNEFTTTKTECKHSLCYVCWSAIGKKAHDDADNYEDDHIEISCPLCREDISFSHN